jgi:hypothetical protein
MPYIFCSECGSRMDHDHHPECSKQTVEQKAEQSLRYYGRWKELNNQINSFYKKYNKEVSFWQGKYLTVKTENNALMKKIVKLKKKDKGGETN